MTTIPRRIVFAVVAAGLSTEAYAQRPSPPERPVIGVFGGRLAEPPRPNHELLFTVSGLGGYDDNPTPQESEGPEGFVPRDPGYLATADVGLEYRRTQASASLELSGHGYVNSFRNLGLTPSYGADASARLIQPVARRHQLTLSQTARSDPFYLPWTFAPVRVDGSGTELVTESTTGYSTRQSWESVTGGSFLNRWTRRDHLESAYRYQVREFDDGVGNTRAHFAGVGYTRSLGRRSDLNVNYERTVRETEEAIGTTRPFTSDSIDLGFEGTSNVSRSGQVSYSFGGGPIYVRTLNGTTRTPLEYVAPAGYGRLAVTFSPAWILSFDYRRAVSVLEGLTAESFVTDSAVVQLDGVASRRVEWTVSGAYSDGRAGAGGAGQFDSYTTTARVQFTVTRWWSAIVEHNFYAYRSEDIADLNIRYPAEMNRNAIRVGLTWQVPLYGAWAEPPAAGPRGTDR